MIPSWVYSSPFQRILHHYLSGVVWCFWWLIATLFEFQHRRDAKLLVGNTSGDILKAVIPPKSQFTSDLRSASALAPPDYYHHVAHKRIVPHRGTIDSFTKTGLVLSTGEQIDADLVCICVGNKAPTYPYLPRMYREYLEHPTGRAHLYRQMIHPHIPRLGFAGYNHGFLHIAACEVGALWLVAKFRGELELPSPKQMLQSAARVAQWKEEHMAFESTMNLAVNTRYQQYIDILLHDLGISQWRKLPNIAAEMFLRYNPTDYRGIVEEFQEHAKELRERGLVQRVMAVDT